MLIPPKPSDLPDGRWTDAALRVLRERYLLKDAAGTVIETPEELCWRVAWAVAQAERTWGTGETKLDAAARQFYTLMIRREFLPNSPTLMNAGKGRPLTLAACYVLPIEDSIPGIFGTLATAARVQQAGGGTGFSFSRLRPNGSRVRSSGGVSSGPLSFLREAYDHMTDAVKQGSTRRGANMAVLRVDHPDILEFIDSKRSGGITNFNISVGTTDEFMAALEADTTYPLRARAGWPRPDGTDCDENEPWLDPGTGEKVELRAREVWQRICKAAWATGDPGLFFIDRANRWHTNPVPSRYQIESTNPCVTADTLVATPEGWIPAEKISPGDVILTVNGPLPVARVEVNTHLVYRVAFSDGGVIRATRGHQLYVRPLTEPGAAFRPMRLDELSRGDLVQVIRRDHPSLPEWSGEAKIISIQPAGFESVYDLYEPTTDTWITEGYVSRGCGEQPLYPNDQCTLGSLNLAAFVERAAGQFDWERLRSAARVATRFLDNVLDVSPAPTPEIGEMVRSIRRIGLGVMGWADALILLGIPYDSDQAVRLAEEVMSVVTGAAQGMSAKLAEDRGPFPLFGESIYRNTDAPRRNATVTTIAPTGSIALLAGCSSGIEPLFAVAYTHTVRRPEGNRVLQIINPLFEVIARERGFYSEELMADVARAGAVRGLPGVPENVQRLFGTAHEIDIEWHVLHQAAFQRHTENGVSKTVNLPHSATITEVDRAYRTAWSLGCLGITVFRDGCKGEQVLTAGTAPASSVSERAEVSETAPGAPLVEPRPLMLHGPTYRLETPLGTAFITVTGVDHDPREVFVRIGKSGSDTEAFSEALGRLISLFLRFNRLPDRRTRLQEILDQLQGIGGSREIGLGPQRIRSVPDAIARAFRLYLGQDEPPTQLALPNPPAVAPGRRSIGDLCPKCGAAAVICEEGCRHCVACGIYSEC